MASTPKSAAARLLFLALPFLYAIAVFTAITSNQFWLDDYGWVSTAARASHDPSYLLDTQADFFRPVVNFVFFANFLISEIDPAGYYRMNIALHLINVALLMFFAYQITRKNFWVTTLTGLLFAGAIANYGEAVIWISGRTELIAVAWYLATLILFWSFCHKRQLGVYSAAIVTFGLALLSKESAVTLLPAMFLLDWLVGATPVRELLRPTRMFRYLPFAVMLAGYLLAQLFVVPDNTVVEARQYQFGPHVVPNLLEYLALMIVPVGPETTVVNLSDNVANFLDGAQSIIGIVLVAFWITAAIWLKSGVYRFAVTWMTLAIVPYAFFTTKTTVRYLYLPSAGFALAVAVIAVGLISRFQYRWNTQRPIKVAALSFLGAILAIQWFVVNAIIQQWSEWQDLQDPAHLQMLEDLIRSLGAGN